MVGQELHELLGLRGQDFILWRVFKIYAQKLLLPSDDAQFDGSFKLGVTTKIGSDAAFGNQVLQQMAGFIVTYDREQRGLRANAHGIEGYVGASAQTVFFAGDAHHRHRCLGAYTVNSAVPITVEHDIADYQHFGLSELRFREWRFLCVHSSSMRFGG